jgi:hypothetical protein
MAHHYIFRPIEDDDYQVFGLGEARLRGDYLQGAFSTGEDPAAMFPFAVMVCTKSGRGHSADWFEDIAYRDGKRIEWWERS